ncbi:DUF2214 domain-containing protein [Chelatococcus sp. XZ-Ab1]|uniref:DUF2214 domain-containing protein n=1 Tax=Chelatococcus sp. XZ-Ab1 TaxID=3034027 RepID=UPI0023E4456D|nr:DUF2214 domain-containing protein [Chelatococcus sp. XZ-Ab1]
MSGFFSEALQALAAWPGAALLRRSSLAYLLLNAAHIASIGLIVGAIVPLDLRLVGLFRRHPLPVLASFLTRIAAVGIVLTVLTGVLLFSVRPAEYVANPAFLTKLGLVAIGVANALLLRRRNSWQAATAGGPVHPGVRAAAALSLVTWMGAIVAGRWIGFL